MAHNAEAHIVYLSHGGGPLPILGENGHRKMISFMKKVAAELPRPDEVLVISAHWEEAVPAVIQAANPDLLYDYYGFPEEAYRIEYPAPGNPSLAEKVYEELRGNTIDAIKTSDRGFDHGVFIPMKLMYPEADIPVTQLSLKKGLDAAAHLAIGKALQGVVKQNLLIIGSGFSFHNLQAFAFNNSEQPDPANNEFQDWLIDTCCGNHDKPYREEQLINWTSAPGARYCHPREEHLLPLHVCQGVAGTNGEVAFDDYIMGKRSVAVRW